MNLEQAYLHINNGILTGKIDAVVSSSHAIIEPQLIKCTVTGKGLNLQQLGYTDAKIKKLRGTYIDEKAFVEFTQKCGLIKKGKEVLYKFKQKPPYAGKERENCLLYISYNSPFDTYTVVWRTTELAARWGADLHLIDNILPKGSTVQLMMLHGYQELNVLPGIAEMYNMKKPKTPCEKYKWVYNRAKQYYGNPIEFYPQWRPIWLVQKRLETWREANGV